MVTQWGCGLRTLTRTRCNNLTFNDLAPGLSGLTRTGRAAGLRGSAADVRTGPAERNPDDEPLVADHGRTIFGPVRVLAADPAVVVDQQVERVREVDKLRGALGLDPLAEEPVVH